ncbi:MAG: hypothetical protein HY823_02895 [Acidobacteria bacterium]|nr:hypothetical protein [Acidobacteriota bacterium]
MHPRHPWLVILLVLAAAPLEGQGHIVGSKHDLSWVYGQSSAMHSTAISNYTQICVFCHTPHSSLSSVSNVPLWNRSLPDPSRYTTYFSESLHNLPSAPGGHSLACLSCHDGTIAVDTVVNMPGPGLVNGNYPLGSIAFITSAHAAMNPTGSAGNCGYCHRPGFAGYATHLPAYMGTNLSAHHPVSILYPSTGAEFVPASTLAGSSTPLRNGRVECTSCHAVHDPAIPPFLRRDNARSALCLSCHLK